MASANSEVRHADAAHADPLTASVLAGEARQLVAFLSAARLRPDQSRDAQAPLTWQEVCDRASLALQLAAA